MLHEYHVISCYVQHSVLSVVSRNGSRSWNILPADTGILRLYIKNVIDQYVEEIVTEREEIIWTGIKDKIALSIKLCVGYLYHPPVNSKWFNPYPTAFPYGNGMVLHFYQQQESSTTKTVHKVINRGLKLMYSRFTLVRISINL